jgi:hypothetical protein
MPTLRENFSIYSKFSSLASGIFVRATKVHDESRNIKFARESDAWVQGLCNAVVTTSGIEPMHRIRGLQFDLAAVRRNDTTASSIRPVVLLVRLGFENPGGFSCFYQICNAAKHTIRLLRVNLRENAVIGPF